ncbi:hypothetical protein E1N52_32110 [Paraburkholderia guartelaensis]|uniref:Thiamine pyrophosphate enzyme N-terminal TPP-binding domain-containing protein n=1 Tax=Paraburkholderia guartelaensis TaxID=2546446 RepID=A0A4R5L8B8_9BURK|nr:hypothetical protein [Paraburkholderia guartelaensis]TDG04012.1 hypothetical protein E1N52_32110 [Paraburkholderia guartelaensis]
MTRTASDYMVDALVKVGVKRVYGVVVSSPDQLPQILNRAMRAANGRKGVATVVVPGNVALAPLTIPAPNWIAIAPVIQPALCEVTELASMLNESSRVTLLCGAGCKNSHTEVIELARMLKAANRARIAVEGVHRIRQPVRCENDRVPRIHFRLPGRYSSISRKNPPIR